MALVLAYALLIPLNRVMYGMNVSVTLICSCEPEVQERSYLYLFPMFFSKIFPLPFPVNVLCPSHF